MPSTLLRPRRLSPLQWALAWLGAGALALALFAAAVPASPLFFPLVSALANVSLFVAALWVLRVAGVRFERFHWAAMGLVWLGAAGYAFWALSRRNFVYYWDYANYILKQYDAEAAFLNGAAAGFGALFATFREDYTSFISLFTEFPFCLTDKSGDSYAASQLVSVFPTLLLLLAGLVRKVGACLRVQNERAYFIIGLSWCVTFPFLRMSAMLAQPDWFGLIFAFAILLLTLDYRFAQPEPVRFGLLFFATAAIILTRRWYLYFVVGYYFCYAALVFAGCGRLARAGQKAEAKRRALRLTLFGAGSIAAMMLLLWPLVRHILQYSYSSHYSYYNVGGLALEVYQQALHLGLLNFLLIVLGLVLCVRRRLPAVPALAGSQLLVGMVLFTRVQNTGSHQTLIFVPAYLLLFLAGAAYLADTLSRRRVLKIGYCAFTCVFAVSVRCSPLTIVALPEPVMNVLASVWPYGAEFLRLDTLIYNRTDLSQIQALATWVDEHCAEGETAYMIPHDMLYSSDIFKYNALPEIQISDKLCFGFSILGTHDFPMSFFESKYVITAEPFPQTYVNEGELSNKLNNLFLAVKDERFQLVETFDMGNGTTFTIWERTVPADRAEVEYYLSAFAEEDAQYPEMFSQIAEAWLAERGL